MRDNTSLNRNWEYTFSKCKKQNNEEFGKVYSKKEYFAKYKQNIFDEYMV